MSYKSDFNDLSMIIYKDEEDSTDETIKNINLELEGNKNIKNDTKIKQNTFEECLNDAKNKFNKLCINIEKNSPPNFLVQKLTDNIHLQYIFKNIDHFYDKTKVFEYKKNIQNKNEDINHISEETTKDTTSSDKNNYKTIDTTKNKEDYKNINNKIYFINDEFFTNINYDNNFNNFDLDKFKSEYNINPKFNDINMNKKNNLNFIRKKRENKENNENNENKKKEDIFNEIKILFNKYIGCNPEYKLYEQQKGFLEKNITIVEKGIPTCIIYFNRIILKKIYLIKEQEFIEEENNIIEILEYIKNNILNYKKMNPLKFKKN